MPIKKKASKKYLLAVKTGKTAQFFAFTRPTARARTIKEMKRRNPSVNYSTTSVTFNNPKKASRTYPKKKTTISTRRKLTVKRKRVKR